MVKLLLDAGADPNVGNGSVTPFMKADRKGILQLQREMINWAVCNGHFDVIELFLNAGIADCLVETPLIKAAKHGQTEVVKLLLDAGAERNTADKDGRTPLHYSC